MKTFYITFGLGSVLGKSYLIAYSENETWLRLALNKTRLPWAGCYTQRSIVEALGLVPLPSAFEAMEHNYGPCEVRA